jgi:hypothetical protein
MNTAEAVHGIIAVEPIKIENHNDDLREVYIVHFSYLLPNKQE